MIKKNKIRLLNKELANPLKGGVIKRRTKLTLKDFLVLRANLGVNIFGILSYLSLFAETKIDSVNITNGTVVRYFFIKIYLESFLKNLIFFEYNIKEAHFNYFILKESKKQSYTTLLDAKKETIVNYSTGVILCSLGFKKHKIYKSLKKQHKGFTKSLNFVKSMVLPKFLKSTPTSKKVVGIIIKGRGKFTREYTCELPNYFRKLKTRTMFLLWVPKLRFSFVKLRQYGRIKRNFRKRIVKTLILSKNSSEKTKALNELGNY